MSFSPQITAKLGLDTAGLKRGVVTAESVMAGAGKALQKKLGLQDGFKSIVAGLGLNIQDLADKIASPWKSAAESAKAIEESTRRTTSLVIAGIRQGNSPEQNLAFGRKQFGRTQRQLEALQGVIGKQEDNFVLGGIPIPNLSKLSNQKDAAALVEELQRIGNENDKLAADIKKQNDEYADQKSSLLDLREVRRDGAAELIVAYRELDKLFDKMSRTAFGTMERRKAELEVLKQQDKVSSIREQRAERARKLATEYVDASDRTDRLKRDAATAQRDRISGSIEDIAAGQGTPTDQARAREVLRLEQQARRQNLSGFAEAGLASLSRADQLRLGITGLDSKSRDPLASSREAILDSERHLARIAQSLDHKDLK